MQLFWKNCKHLSQVFVMDLQKIWRKCQQEKGSSLLHSTAPSSPSFKKPAVPKAGASNLRPLTQPPPKRQRQNYTKSPSAFPNPLTSGPLTNRSQHFVPAELQFQRHQEESGGEIIVLLKVVHHPVVPGQLFLTVWLISTSPHLSDWGAGTLKCCLKGSWSVCKLYQEVQRSNKKFPQFFMVRNDWYNIYKALHFVYGYNCYYQWEYT